MSLIAKANGSEPAPAGSHAAVCIKVVDLGIQDHPAYGASHKVYLEFELSDEAMENTGKPYVIGRRFTLSLSNKATLREVLESWRGRPFTSEELRGFGLDRLVGVPALVNIIHRDTDGKTYANLAGISPLPKGMAKPVQVNEGVCYAVEQGEDEVFDSLPDWLQKLIRERVGGSGDEKKTPATAATGTGANVDL